MRSTVRVLKFRRVCCNMYDERLRLSYCRVKRTEERRKNDAGNCKVKSESCCATPVRIKSYKTTIRKASRCVRSLCERALTGYERLSRTDRYTVLKQAHSPRVRTTEERLGAGTDDGEARRGVILVFPSFYVGGLTQRSSISTSCPI